MHRGNSYLNEHCDNIIGSQLLSSWHDWNG
jgi:hypothetical protein